MGILAVIILEIVGVWFLNTAADIPEGVCMLQIVYYSVPLFLHSLY